jgi:hypothetical protein
MNQNITLKPLSKDAINASLVGKQFVGYYFHSKSLFTIITENSQTFPRNFVTSEITAKDSVELMAYGVAFEPTLFYKGGSLFIDRNDMVLELLELFDLPYYEDGTRPAITKKHNFSLPETAPATPEIWGVFEQNSGCVFNPENPLRGCLIQEFPTRYEAEIWADEHQDYLTFINGAGGESRESDYIVVFMKDGEWQQS